MQCAKLRPACCLPLRALQDTLPVVFAHQEARCPLLTYPCPHSCFLTPCASPCPPLPPVPNVEATRSLMPHMTTSPGGRSDESSPEAAARLEGRPATPTLPSGASGRAAALIYCASSPGLVIGSSNPLQSARLGPLCKRPCMPWPQGAGSACGGIANLEGVRLRLQVPAAA